MMKAVVRHSPGKKNIKILNIENPFLHIKEKKAIIKIHAVGVCGSDVENYHKTHLKSEVPYILGHEFSGTIFSLPKNYKGHLTINDKVTCETVHSVCNKCDLCKNKLYNLCLERKMIGGSTMNGAYSRFVKVPLEYIHKLKKNISMDDAAIIEPMCVAYNAVVNNSNVKKNNFTVIFGGGTIAIMCAKMVNYLSGKVILVCTKNDLPLIKKLKNTNFHKILIYSDDIENKIFKVTKDKGISLIVDAVGGVKQTFETSINIIAPGGQITKIGWFLNKSEFDLDKLIKKNIRFQGSFSHNYPIWEKCIKLLSEKKIKINDIITHKLPLKDWKLAFDLSKKRKAIKILLDPNND